MSKGLCSVSPVSSYSIVKPSLDSNVISHTQTCRNSTETSVENRHSRIPLGTICGDSLGNSSLENKFNNSLGVNLDTCTSQDYKEYGESVAPTLLRDSLVEASQERKLSELHSENKISNQSQSELPFECVTPTFTCTSYKFQVGFPEKQSSCTHIAITHDLEDTSLKKDLPHASLSERHSLGKISVENSGLRQQSRESGNMTASSQAEFLLKEGVNNSQSSDNQALGDPTTMAFETNNSKEICEESLDSRNLITESNYTN